ncbi:MAG: hydrogenase expression/formation protein HypE [Caldilineales bacterium]|nr:hydrogenase expression/formation protein HypE [Caldilineales bacterium]MDW8317950.1 hydrogenase expression/formation protein HypE [Anaerolineae bacterium]
MHLPDFTLACPIPISEYPAITLAHGGGGRLTHMLIERMLRPAFANPALDALHDGAILTLFDGAGPAAGAPGLRLAFTTDSYVISPRFFPGGDIGSLAVHGTINDLAMCGAQPLALSAALILEEGLPMEELWQVVRSMQAAAAAAGVPIVTGDTKVVDRGKGDGLFINTSGIGLIPADVEIAPQRARPGDAVLVSGAIAVHGIAIMSVREGLEFETTLASDTAPLHGLVGEILAAGGRDVHVLRDPTRGGVASALNEIAAAARVGIRLDERAIPVDDEVRGACEILGLDPLYVANEGKCLAVVAPEAAEAVLAAMRRHPLGRQAALIGEVVDAHPGKVFLRSRIGGLRVVDMISGEQLPRIC